MTTKVLLQNYIDTIPIINTHSHHLPSKNFHSFNLTSLIKNSYVYWCGMSLDDNIDNKQEFLDHVRFKSYFVWLQKAIKKIYNINESITSQSWKTISDAICQAHKNRQWHIEILTQHCHYEKSIIDAYWDFGSYHGLSKLFCSAFRIDSFLFGYEPTKEDHNQNSFYKLFNRTFSDMDSYVDFIRHTIQLKLADHCVALKSAIAYDRDIHFVETSKKRANRVFSQPNTSITVEDIKAFQDYIFFKICEIAAELDVPLQIHTGLGKLEDSNPMQLQEVISKNPNTKFVLFHGGFPWTDDLSGLLHVYSNVYADLCWLPLISPTAAKRALHEYIEVATSDKLMWGCDTLTSEESYGALLALKDVLSDVLSEKIESDYMQSKDAQKFIYNMLYLNPKRLYKL